MKQLVFIIISLQTFLSFGQITESAAKVEQWGRYEITLRGSSSGNPFKDVSVTGTFTKGSKAVEVQGFYDGNGMYKIRFMPTEIGQWTFTTKSNQVSINNKSGSFYCTNPSANNHGPVRVHGTYNFKYADGKTYYPFGTTLYAWVHQDKALQEETLQTLATAPFNKVRMCVFPKYYTHVENEPELYPYLLETKKKSADGKIKFTWDFNRFDPLFFQHLEQRIDDLGKLGIEADVIIFHPYDKGKWGFDSMGKKNDLQYIKYLVARLSSFRNVWWSLANEYDFIKSKSRQDWDEYAKAVVKNDPYRHLCSIHNGNIYYDHWKPEFTHASIQNGSAVEDFGRAVLLRDAYFKPVIYDEVCYEGNLTSRWGRLTGEEMTAAFWQGIIAGTYVTHGETYQNDSDIIFWAKGGKLRGTSPARIGFLRKILEEGPGPLMLADPWKDNKTAQADSNFYLIYLGKEVQSEWPFSLPKKNGPSAGAKFKAEIIDTWNMTITPVPEVFELADPVDYRLIDKNSRRIPLPGKPYLAIRITRI
ncbi:MAG TPA: DUF5060 domain-containing protein [Segetibacter sp.]|nr:DUF5060 domain-containing protein [Segetibacter sp.]